MVDKLKNDVRLPVWAVSLIVTLMLSAFTWTLANTTESQRMRSEIEYNKASILAHETTVKEALDNKASKEKVDMMYEAVLRLERKFDLFMQDKK